MIMCLARSTACPFIIASRLQRQRWVGRCGHLYFLWVELVVLLAVKSRHIHAAGDEDVP